MKSLASLSTIIVPGLLLGLAGAAAAQPIDQPAPAAGDHDPSTAFDVSAGATAASLATIGLGIAVSESSHDGAGAGLIGVGAASLLVTPALGHVYGEHALFTRGTALRLAGGGLVIIGGLATLSDGVGALGCAASSPDDGTSGCSSHHSVAGLVVAGVGLAAIVGGSVLDLATAGSSTRAWNAAHAHELAIVPMVANSGAQTVTGIGVGGRF